jgi:hypothetical protein
MLPSQKWRLVVLVLAFTCRVPSLSAVIVEGRQYRGTQIQCVHGGAWISDTQLGVYSRARLYEQVFTGTVQSAVEISLTDKRLQIIRDEIFLGDVAGEITATVNQACLPENLPEIKAGDKWVFYLRTKEYLHPDANPPYITTDGLMVVFDSPSKPVSQAQSDICLLRHHSDDDGSCGAAPTPRHTRILCRWEAQPFPLTSSFPRSVLFEQLPTTPFQWEGINLTHITAPEFRAHDSKTVNGTAVIPQAHPWPPPCTSEVHSSRQSD